MRPRCWIALTAWRELWDEAARWRIRETGGALLGWRDGEDAVVARVLGPGPQAGHGLRSFEPDVRWQQREGERIYRESGRRVAYVGDWHTHPLTAPTPSAQDRSAARLIAGDEAFRAPAPLSAIAGARWVDQIRGARSELAVYVWRSERFEQMAIELCQVGSLLNRHGKTR